MSSQESSPTKERGSSSGLAEWRAVKYNLDGYLKYVSIPVIWSLAITLTRSEYFTSGELLCAIISIDDVPPERVKVIPWQTTQEP